MNRSEKFSQEIDDKVYVQAAEWIDLLSKHPLDTITGKRLKKWLNADPNHRLLIKRMIISWSDPDLLNTLKEFEKGTWLQRLFFNFSFGKIGLIGTTFVSLLLVSIFTIKVLYQQTTASVTPEPKTYLNGYKAKEIFLADGSAITLSGSSEIAVEFNTKARRASLQKGAAFFNIARDSQHPFEVSIETSSVVTAAGAQFNIDKTSKGIEIIVYEGPINVQQNQDAKPLLLRTGEQVRISSGVLSVIKLVNLEKRIDWRSGWIEMNGEPLSNLLEQLNRYSSSKIKVLQQDLNDLPVTGRFDLDDPPGSIETILSLFFVEVQKINGHYLLSQKQS